MKKTKPTKKEIREVEADATYWGELSDLIPQWKLHSFSWRYSAIYCNDFTVLGGDPLVDAVVPTHTRPDSFIRVTGEQRSQIIAAIKGTEQ